MALYIIHRLMGAPLQPKSVRVIMKVSFEDRFDYYLHCHLYYPVFNHRYPQRSLASGRLRNVDPTDSLWLVVFPLQFLGNLFKILLNSPFFLLDTFKGFTVNSRCPPVRFDKSVGVTQDVLSIYLVIEKIETVLLLLLGLPV